MWTKFSLKRRSKYVSNNYEISMNILGLGYEFSRLSLRIGDVKKKMTRV